MHKILALLVFAALFNLACQDGRSGERDGDKLNLILISLDTCRADRISAYGLTSEVTTPRIDALAAESAVFSNCLAQSTGTRPSHLSLFSGHYVHRHGSFHNHEKSTYPFSFVEDLRQQGWATAAFSGGGPLRESFHFGFETFSTPDEAQRDMDETVPLAIEWIRERAEQPFFAFIHGFDPHCPYWPPEPYRSEHAGWYEGDFDPRKRCGNVGFRQSMMNGEVGEQELRYLNDLYDAGLAKADAALGGLFDYLSESGLIEDTLVVFTSDHGESLGEHNWIGHTRVWGEQIHVPLIMRFPGGQHSGSFADPVELVDLYPTLITALELPQRERGLQGQDLMPVLRDGDSLRPDRMRISQYGRQEAVYFGDRWKIVIEQAPKRTGAQPTASRSLFDLQADPKETRDLYTTDEGRARFEQLHATYRRWRLETAVQDEVFLGQASAPLTEQDRQILAEMGYIDGEVVESSESD